VLASIGIKTMMLLPRTRLTFFVGDAVGFLEGEFVGCDEILQTTLIRYNTHALSVVPNAITHIL
jgi:hypothetical protein